jgi:hypothetical protein
VISIQHARFMSRARAATDVTVQFCACRGGDTGIGGARQPLCWDIEPG